MKKKPVRNMRLSLSCKRKGKTPESFQINWREPEEKALLTFARFHEFLMAKLKAHGLMKE